MDGHAMLLPFDTDSEDFVRGFELGRIWSLLRSAPEESVEEYAHVTSAEMLLRMAEATDREVKSEELGDGWLRASFAPARVVAE
jgi:hypothetical protein